MTADEAPEVETLRQLLPQISMLGVLFLHVEMHRKEGEPPEEGLQFPVNIGVLFQTAPGTAAFQVTVSVDRPDISVAVAVAVQYSMPEPDPLTDPTIAGLFAERVAIPAAYPYARAKIHEVTVDAGTAPVTLNVLIPGGALRLLGADEQEAGSPSGE
jgi:hypothetical protein